MSLTPREQRWLQRMTQLCKLLAEPNDKEQLHKVILQSAVELTRAQRGFLVLLQRAAQNAYRLHVVESLGFDKSLLQSPAGQVSRTIVEHILNNDQSVVSTRDKDAALMNASSIQARQTLSIIAVPLRLRSAIRGALYLDHRHPKAFTAADLPILQTFADQAALTLEELERSLLKDPQPPSQQSPTGLGALVGQSPPMRQLYELIERYARSWEHVLILGENGSGKELVARELHRLGSHPKEPFLAENAAAITPTLFESELFGHEKGAFTGAHKKHKGLFQRAQNGTLLIDEIGELPLAIQAKLLRVLQERAVRPLGSDKECPVSCRVIAATHKDLPALVQKGAFRQDLFYRLDVLRITVPPLRQRPEDIPLLIESLCKEIKTPLRFAKRTMALLQAWPWPGNVRELHNEIRRLALSGPGRVPAKHLSPHIRQGPQAAPQKLSPETIHDAERTMIEKALKECQGNKAKAARQLGIPRSNLYRLIERYEL